MYMYITEKMGKFDNLLSPNVSNALNRVYFGYILNKIFIEMINYKYNIFLKYFWRIKTHC